MASINPYASRNAATPSPPSNAIPSAADQSMSSTSSSLAKGRKWMKVLCWAEFVLAIFALTLGSACTGINAQHERTVCTFGTGIWVGLLSLCCAIVGMAAIQVSSAQRKLLIAYFAFCVVGTLASVILWGISCMWIEKANKLYKIDNESYELTSVTLNACLLSAAICQTVCNFLSAVLLAHYYWGWCCRSGDFTSPVAYVRADDVPDVNAETGGGHIGPQLYARRSDTTDPSANNDRFFY